VVQTAGTGKQDHNDFILMDLGVLQGMTHKGMTKTNFMQLADETLSSLKAA
jgi:hypothetical protein